VDPLTPVRALDRLQRRRGVLGFPLGVLKKFADDHAGNLAVLMAWYGFFCCRCLVFVTGFPPAATSLRRHRQLHDRPVPLVGTDIKSALRGSTVAPYWDSSPRSVRPRHHARGSAGDGPVWTSHVAAQLTARLRAC
jgi:hypothetical protein